MCGIFLQWVWGLGGWDSKTGVREGEKGREGEKEGCDPIRGGKTPARLSSNSSESLASSGRAAVSVANRTGGGTNGQHARGAACSGVGDGTEGDTLGGDEAGHAGVGLGMVRKETPWAGTR